MSQWFLNCLRISSPTIGALTKWISYIDSKFSRLQVGSRSDKEINYFAISREYNETSRVIKWYLYRIPKILISYSSSIWNFDDKFSSGKILFRHNFVNHIFYTACCLTVTIFKEATTIDQRGDKPHAYTSAQIFVTDSDEQAKTFKNSSVQTCSVLIKH